MAQSKNWKNIAFYPETINAVFIISLVAVFIFANFAVGFVWPIFLFAMVVGAIISIQYPASGLYSIVFLTMVFERFFTLQPLIIGDQAYKLYPIDILLAAVAMGTIFEYFVRRKAGAKESGQWRFEKRDWWFFAFLLAVTATFVRSLTQPAAEFSIAFSSLKNYVFYSWLYILAAYHFSNRDRLGRLVRFAAAGAVAIVFFLLIGILRGEGLWTEYTPLSTEGVRVLAFTHAFYLSLAFIFATAFLFLSQSPERLKGLVILMGIWLAGIVGSMMRHLWLGLLMAAATFNFLLLPSKRRLMRSWVGKTAFLGAMVIFMTGYLAFVFPDTGLARSFRDVAGVLYTRSASFANYSSDDSFTWRGAAWKEGFKEFTRQPVFGIGFGHKIFLYDEKNRDFVEVRNIHNSLLVIMVQSGIIGLGLLLSVVASVLKPVWQRAKTDWVALASIVGTFFYLFVCLFQPYLEANLLGIFFWIMLGVARSFSVKAG